MAIQPRRTREFTFPDSGRKIHLPIVSLAAMAVKIQRKYKRPLPPLQEVDYGDRKGKEYNWSDPNYVAKVKEYEAFVDVKATELAMDRAMSIKLNKEQQAELDEWKATNPGDWDEMDDDHRLWIEEIGILTDNDLMALMEFVTGPTEEVIASVQDGFQSREQGSQPVEGADA